MRRASLFVSVLVLAALLLAACGGEETSTAVPGTTDVPPVTAEVTPTEIVDGTETADPADTTTTPVVPVTGEESPSRVTNLLDYDVWNQEGEQIGDVEDMVLDLDSTTISYVVVGTGGLLGLGEKEVLVPWDMLEVQTAADEGPAGDQNAFIFTGDQEFYNNAPDVDVDSVLPDRNTTADDWDADIRSFWQSGVAPETGATDTPGAEATVTATMTPGTDQGLGEGQFQGNDLQGVILATEVLGSVITVQGNDQALSPDPGLGTETPEATAATDATAVPLATATLGPDPATVPGTETMTATIEDLIVDPDTGEILYLVITGGFAEGERWIPVPLGFVQWDAVNESFVLRVNAAALQNAPFFQDGQFPDFSVDTWDDEFDGFWDNPDIGTPAP